MENITLVTKRTFNNIDINASLLSIQEILKDLLQRVEKLEEKNNGKK